MGRLHLFVAFHCFARSRVYADSKAASRHHCALWKTRKLRNWVNYQNQERR